ncbi:MAG: TIGR04211 family SH3 domain-containing protein [Desulfosarcina sp.]|nr:TIGR04211 family SH3 domain-containing protein [Desulfobacterales bacterium]
MPIRKYFSIIRPGHVKLTGILLAVIVAGVFLATDVMAQSWYVNVGIKSPLRSGPGQERKILTFVATGERVQEVLEEGEEWMHVRMANGKEGWMLKRYLTTQKPSNLLLEELQRRYAEIEAKATRLEEENNQLKSQNEKYSSTLGTKTAAMETLNRDFSELKEESDAKSFQMRKYLVFFFSGAGILFIGILLGLVMKRQRRKSMYMV